MKHATRSILEPTRYDYMLIWGHGQKYKEKIIQKIDEHQDFTITLTHDFIAKNMEKLIKAVYSHDYAPFEHLRGKTRYLKSVPHDTTLIVFKNHNPQEDYLGEGAYRHYESLTLKQFKENLRDLYNPYEKNKRTHHHVIHASDNQKQTHYLLKYLASEQKTLKYLGYEQGIENLKKHDRMPFYMPPHVQIKPSYIIKSVPKERIACRLLTKNLSTIENMKGLIHEGKGFTLVAVEQSPHVQFLKGHKKPYQKYMPYKAIERHYEKLIAFHKTTKNPYNHLGTANKKYIICYKEKGYYAIYDGLHKCSILVAQGKKDIIILDKGTENEPKHAKFKNQLKRFFSRLRKGKVLHH